MTVQELIDKLQAVEDKTQQVVKRGLPHDKEITQIIKSVYKPHPHSPEEHRAVIIS